MKYNEKYDRYVDDDLIVYRWDKKLDKLVQCSTVFNTRYMTLNTKQGRRKLHRVLWETIMGEIPEGFQIDHINTNTKDNRLENLRLVSPKENMNNPLTLKHISNGHRNKHTSYFGEKYFEHYGYSRTENPRQYGIAWKIFHRHGYFNWENETK